MGEAYISRRGGSGGAKLNIFSGSTAPSSSVGIFGQTTSTVSNKIVVPEQVSSSGNWTTLAATPFTTLFTQTYNIVNNGLDTIYLHNNLKFYAYSTTSNTYSEKAAPNGNSNNNYRAIMAYLDGKVYKLGGWHDDEGTYRERSGVYSVSANTWSALNFQSTLNYCGAGAYNGFIFMGYGYRTVAIQKYSISSDTATVFASDYYDVYKSGENGTGFINGEYFYMLGGSQSTKLDQHFTRFNLNSAISNRYQTPYNGYSGLDYVWNSFMIGAVVFALENTKNYFYYLNISDASPKWTNVNSNPPDYFNTSSMACGKCTSIGNNAYAFGAGQNRNVAMKYSATGDSYPSGTLVVETGGVNNVGTLSGGTKENVNIPVKNVYYSNGTTLTKIPGKVRKTGGAWTDIV